MRIKLVGCLLVIWGTALLAGALFGGEWGGEQIIWRIFGLLVGGGFWCNGIFCLLHREPLAQRCVIVAPENGEDNAGRELTNVGPLFTNFLPTAPPPFLERPLPGWSAPLLGAGFGVLFALVFAWQDGTFLAWAYIVGCMAPCVLAGLFVWLLDSPSPRIPHVEEEPEGMISCLPAQADEQQASFAARLTALLSVLLCWVPVLGPLIGVAAVLANRGARGGARTMSWIGLLLSLAVSTGVIIIMIMAELERKGFL
jgi:hypothetical protein